ncbi:hypothetical protein FB446DRAFT_793496 [Lentinula raphanica]|nr:hypothetical protein FB446DRAFT_793496 [Lentinula raphanica]
MAPDWSQRFWFFWPCQPSPPLPFSSFLPSPSGGAPLLLLPPLRIGVIPPLLCVQLLLLPFSFPLPPPPHVGVGSPPPHVSVGSPPAAASLAGPPPPPRPLIDNVRRAFLASVGGISKVETLPRWGNFG